MSVPVRTTYIQRHREALLRKYKLVGDVVWCVDTDKPAGRSTSGVAVYVGGKPGCVSYNRMAWLLATGDLPDRTVQRSGNVLVCSGKSVQLAQVQAKAAPLDLEQYVYGLAPAELCNLYAAVMQRCAEAGINPERRTRTIIQEVPL